MTIDRRDGTAVFDFAGTGPEVYGNTNAPPAVTYSAIIYSLRCMVHQDIPLNQVGIASPSCLIDHLCAMFNLKLNTCKANQCPCSI